MRLHGRLISAGRGGCRQVTPDPTLLKHMIPELKNENTVVSALRRNLHLAFRRRTWRFKRNARLNELLPQKPVRRHHTLWAAVAPALVALLMCRA